MLKRAKKIHTPEQPIEYNSTQTAETWPRQQMIPEAQL